MSDVYGPFVHAAMLDFLCYYPNRCTTMLELEQLPPLLRDVWQHWARVPTTRRAPMGFTPTMLVNAPLWFNQLEAFQGPNGTSKTAFALSLEHCHRGFYGHLARCGLRRLTYILDNGQWPSKEQFNLCLEIHAQTYDGAPTTFTWLYKRFTDLARQVATRTPRGHPIPPLAAHPLVWPMADKESFVPLYRWHKLILKEVASSRLILDRAHPMLYLQPRQPDDLYEYVKLVRRSKRHAMHWEFAREHIESLGLGLIMVLFHQIWTWRNRAKYEDSNEPRATYVFGVTVVRWLSHVRNWLRPGNTPAYKIESLRKVIDHLV
ncbi:hypothetical protein ACHHYP_07669 [Achlya hypogyna]|uniref:Uncharacterized protein n=1 Tax=Achlya hypogyna TaxID=1202772 RepID=A0A1V9YQN3_ACHHY|nr:hypothetical protein ACHHYP_07669 [Achlya hypogyna]